MLSYFEEMSGREVALAMDLTEGAVESLLVRARRGLRDNMKRLGFVRGEDL
ncbi:MAG: sigma factor-like helix-turn-helix DNA-binding protein [Bdellovibrionales bacterium]